MTPVGTPAGVPGMRAVVVNYNAAAELADCVASLRAAGVADVVVVDNGSVDGSRDRLARADPDAVWLPSGGNVGYGRAANLGAASGGRRWDWLLVCNPDLWVAPGAASALVDRLRAEPGLGLVGPRLTNPDGTLYPSVRTFPNLVDALGHGLLGLVAPDNRFTRRYRMTDWDHARPTRADWVSGACFVARRAAWDDIGGFDPSYFMYMEDVDLCWRAGRSGWGVGFEPAATATHVQGVSARLHPYRMLAAHHRSVWRFARRTTTGARRAVLPVVAAGLFGHLAVAAARQRFGPPAAPLRAADGEVAGS